MSMAHYPIYHRHHNEWMNKYLVAYDYLHPPNHPVYPNMNSRTPVQCSLSRYRYCMEDCRLFCRVLGWFS